MSQSIRAVLFDLDDTLYDRGAAFRAWAMGFAAAHCPAVSPGRCAEIVAGLVSIDAGGYGDRIALVREMRRLAPTIAESDADVLESFRAGFVREMRIETDVAALLDRLVERSIPFGIITNGSTAPQWRKIVHLGLDRRTECIFISESFGVKKPDARIFQAAAAQLGFAPGEILFVGDHAENDIRGANRAGMRTAWLGRGAEWPAQSMDALPDYNLVSLAELIRLLPYS